MGIRIPRDIEADDLCTVEGYTAAEFKAVRMPYRTGQGAWRVRVEVLHIVCALYKGHLQLIPGARIAYFLHFMFHVDVSDAR